MEQEINLLRIGDIVQFRNAGIDRYRRREGTVAGHAIVTEQFAVAPRLLYVVKIGTDAGLLLLVRPNDIFEVHS